MKQATGQFGTQSTLQGSITATVTRTILTNAGPGTITVTIDTNGTQVARFDDAHLQALAVSIAGKTRQEAQAILSANKDIAGANIQISGSNGDVLPTDMRQIRMVTNH